MSRSRSTHHRRDLRFSNENVQLLGGNFYGRIFTRRELSSRYECYQDFASQQDSRRDPGEEFFSWRDPSEYRFLGGILAKIRGGNFSREGSHRENGPPQRDPGGIPVRAGNLGGILARSQYLQGLCLSISVHKSEKQSKLCLPGSQYLSSFRELTKSILIVFLFQNFRELATVASFENYPISTLVQSPIAEVRASK